MKRTFNYIFLALFMAFAVSACSLFGSSDEESDSATVAEDDYEKDEFEAEGESDGEESDGDDFADGDEEEYSDGEGGDTGDVASEVEEDGLSDDDEYPDDDYSDDESVATSEGDGPSDDDFDVADGGEVEGDEMDIPDAPMTDNEEQDLFANEAATDDTFYEDVGSAPVAAKTVSVKKMKAAPFNRAGSNINRLYVVRADDDFASISTKLYGADRSADLLSWNSHFRGRTLKVGDKIYYNSPNSPNDSEMKTYFEDVGLTPQYYTSQDGENIRAISEKLLGHPRSWMEVYATNDVDTKGELLSGTQLRYWNEDGSAPIAANNFPTPAPDPVEEPIEAMPPDEGEIDFPMDEPTEVANLDEPGGPEEDFGGNDDFTPPPTTGSVAPPPPPSMPTAAAPPPPPPMPMAKKPMNNNKPKVGGAAATDDSMIMGALGGLLILAAIILLVFIRRSRAKRVNFSQTQI